MAALTCSISRMVIGLRIIGGEDLPPPVAAHAASCLRCQATIAQSRGLRRELASLGRLTYAAPPELEPAVLAAIGGPKGSEERVPQWAPAVAASVLVASALVWWFVRRTGLASQTA